MSASSCSLCSDGSSAHLVEAKSIQAVDPLVSPDSANDAVSEPVSHSIDMDKDKEG